MADLDLCRVRARPPRASSSSFFEFERIWKVIEMNTDLILPNTGNLKKKGNYPKSSGTSSIIYSLDLEILHEPLDAEVLFLSKVEKAVKLLLQRRGAKFQPRQK